MKKDQVYTDEHGIRWVTASRVAEIWNTLSREKYGIDANYTRWSVYQRRDEIPSLDLPLGRLFREDDAREVTLRPRETKREDTAERNIQRGKKRKKKGEANEEGSSGSSVMLKQSGLPASLPGVA